MSPVVAHRAISLRCGTWSPWDSGHWIGRTASPVTATTDFLAPYILSKCGRAVPASRLAPRENQQKLAANRFNVNARAVARTQLTADVDDLFAKLAPLAQWLPSSSQALSVPKPDPPRLHRANVTKLPEIEHIVQTHAVDAQHSELARSGPTSPR